MFLLKKILAAPMLPGNPGKSREALHEFLGRVFNHLKE